MSNKRLFIIAPSFPPSSLPPAQRIRLMIPYLKELGFDPVVYTVKHKYREEEADNWLLKSCGENFKLVELNALNRKICRFFGIGDIGLRLLPFLFFRLILDSLRKKPVFVLYPVPPWNTLVIAPIIKMFTGIPYGIDYIDPWIKRRLTMKNVKEKINQNLAMTFESWVLKNASLFYSVSQEINFNIIKRNEKLNIPHFVAPYGVEQNDYFRETQGTNEILTLRYIGAIWPPANPVLDNIFKVFTQLLNKGYSFKVEFYGSSYTKVSKNKGHLNELIAEYKLQNVITEEPNRVKYQEALKLTKTSDILFLFGDTGKEYAASKLMGLIASKKAFFAFLHKESYPFKLLKAISFPYLVGYTSRDNETILFDENEFFMMLSKILEDYSSFIPFDLTKDELKEKTAKGMTKKIVSEINKVIKND